jgi:hypothetical protein
MQTPLDKKAHPPKHHPQHDVRVKSMSMGSWRADGSKGGALRARRGRG